MNKTRQSLKNKEAELMRDAKKQRYTCWKEDEIIALCAAVEVRPMLWATEFSNVQKKDKIWTVVHLELKSKGFDIDPEELKTKWLGIRHNFMDSIRKRRKPSKRAKYLAFLNEDPNSTTIEKVSEASPESPPSAASKGRSVRVAATTKAEAASIGVSSNPALDPHLDESQPKLTLNRVISSALGMPTTSELNLKTSDPNLTLCEYLLAELCMLSDLQSIHLRGILMKVVYDFGETLEVQSTRKSNFY